jgi:hypothetical protein
MRGNTVLALDEVLESSAIEVRDNAGIKAVYAKQAIRQDSVIFYLKGNISTRPSKYTIQLGTDQHLNPPVTRKPKDDLDYSWQYLNHCCAPNGYINMRERTFRALRDIAPGEEVTFNYLTTESEMAAPFNCLCGSANCFAFIQGRNFLNREQADRLALILGEDSAVNSLIPTVRKVSGGLKNSRTRIRVLR